jgi:hypothetical protein
MSYTTLQEKHAREAQAATRTELARRALSGLKPALLVFIAAAAGVVLWQVMRLSQGALRPLLAGAPEWLSLATNAGIEEALRLGLALAAAHAIRRLGLEPGTAGLAVVSACVLAALENASYLERFPTFDIYWRLGYSLPIHAGAAALYAIATAPDGRGRRRIKTIAVSFAAAWAWHAAFNLVAALAPFPALSFVGTALNLAALTALVAALAIRYGYWSVYAAR